MIGLALLAAAAASPVCGPAAAPTITANDIARVYRDGKVVRGCARGGKVAVPLAVPGDDIPLLDARLDGPYVLALVTEGEVGPRQIEPYSSADVIDLRTGTSLAHDEIAYGDRAGGLAVEPGGFVAWVVRSRSRGTRRVVDTVVAADGRGFSAEKHWVTRRVGPVTQLGVEGRAVSFAASGSVMRVLLPSMAPPAISVSPSPAGRAEKVTVKFTAGPSPVGPLTYIAGAGSAEVLERGDDGSCFGAGLPADADPGERVRLRVAPFSPWCGSSMQGVLLAAYGAPNPERCKPAALPCAGWMRAGTFGFRVR